MGNHTLSTSPETSTYNVHHAHAHAHIRARDLSENTSPTGHTEIHPVCAIKTQKKNKYFASIPLRLRVLYESKQSTVAHVQSGEPKFCPVVTQVYAYHTVLNYSKCSVSGPLERRV